MAPDSTIRTERLELKVIDDQWAGEVIDYLKRNRGFFGRWEPAHEDKYYSLPAQKERLMQEFMLTGHRRFLQFNLFHRGKSEIIGDITFSNIIPWPFKSCLLSYKLSEKENGKGLMTEAISAAIDFVFTEWKLHRVEANIMPGNTPSIRLVERLGFREEGLSKDYLEINGVWEDHLRFALINPLGEG